MKIQMLDSMPTKNLQKRNSRMAKKMFPLALGLLMIGTAALTGCKSDRFEKEKDNVLTTENNKGVSTQASNLNISKNDTVMAQEYSKNFHEFEMPEQNMEIFVKEFQGVQPNKVTNKIIKSSDNHELNEYDEKDRIISSKCLSPDLFGYYKFDYIYDKDGNYKAISYDEFDKIKSIFYSKFDKENNIRSTISIDALGNIVDKKDEMYLTDGQKVERMYNTKQKGSSYHEWPFGIFFDLFNKYKNLDVDHVVVIGANDVHTGYYVKLYDKNDDVILETYYNWANNEIQL